MHEPQKLQILVLTDRESLARRWSEMLHPIAERIWLSRDQLPPGARPDVIVADAAAKVGPPACGVVRVGGPELGAGQGCDGVCLPADVSVGELSLACRLTARISHLQRQLDAEAALRRRLRDEAMTDPLTGLPNRRAWDDVLGQRLAAGGAQPLCLAILDLDHFKQVNDVHGHAVGDDVLRQTGKTAVAGLRHDDFVARLGGDEFGLLLAVHDETSAASAVNRLRAALPLRLAAKGLPQVTASAGYSVALCNGPPNPGAFYASADEALRAAKQHGRDRTVGYGAQFRA